MLEGDLPETKTACHCALASMHRLMAVCSLHRNETRSGGVQCCNREEVRGSDLQTRGVTV